MMAAHSPKPDFSGSGLQNSGNFHIGHDLHIGASNDDCLAALWLTDPRYDKKRIENAKGGLLRESYVWILNHDDFQRWQEQVTDNFHLVSFFCQATDERLNNATGVLRGLIYLLIDQHTELKSYVDRKYKHAGKSLFEDVNAWVALSDIFISMLRHPKLPNIILVIDALDECEVDLQKLLDLIMETSAEFNVKWLLSSRNKIEIEEKLRTDQSRARLSLELKRNAVHVSNAVNAYTDHCLLNIPAIQERADLYVVVRDQMRQKAIPAGLSELYSRMVRQIQGLEYNGSIYCQRVLFVVTTTYRPLHLEELEVLSGLAKNELRNGDIKDIVNSCGSFLSILEDRAFIIHQSAQDLLHEHAKSVNFPKGVKIVHYYMFSRSIRIMSETLRRDIYRLDDWGMPPDQIVPPIPDPLTPVRYSCIHWFDHLNMYQSEEEPISEGLLDRGILDMFLRDHYLHWLEALSIFRDVLKGVSAMAALNELLCVRNTGKHLHGFIQDATIFIRHNRPAIESSPLQAYASALIFSPSHSIIRRHFQAEEPQWLIQKPAVDDNWGACLACFQLGSMGVLSVAFSPDGKYLAACANQAYIWHISTGKCTATFGDSEHQLTGLALAPNGTRLATGTVQGQIILWDVATGEGSVVGNHDGERCTVAFSPNGSQLASGSGFEGDPEGDCNTVKLWDISSKVCTTLGGHRGAIRTVVFSPNGCQIASSSNSSSSDYTIKLWDIATGKCTIFEDSTSGVRSLAFSPDGRQLASGCFDGTIRLWNIETGECIAKCKHTSTRGHPWHSICSILFSPNGSQLASGSSESSIKIRDTSTMECLSTIKAHSSMVFFSGLFT
ncbi:quinon protein alcohol dehydrogenase-like superfamily [Rostrohypoxylon terebratum]|nr:quinon protein alcohol dehydrogenase-like superfamily [Rostrohypoxylon terebratum]